MSRDTFRDDAELVRRDFAAGWARVGEAWGIAPSTAAVQGYFLLKGGPLTEADLRGALGLSHRAAFGAVVECERWGLIEPADAVRVGRRGPAARSWRVVGDHWEWFRRVAASRKQREADPVLPLLEQCRDRAVALGDQELTARVASLVDFMHDFDRSVGAIVGADADSIGHLLRLLARLDDSTVRGLIGALRQVDAPDLEAAAVRIARMRPDVLRRMIRLAGNPAIASLLDRLG